MLIGITAVIAAPLISIVAQAPAPRFVAAIGSARLHHSAQALEGSPNPAFALRGGTAHPSRCCVAR
jgi:hypothetical protein